MRKVVWTVVVGALGLVWLGTTSAAAQDTSGTARQQLRARIEQRIDKQFKKLDQNGNGVIDRSEWTRKPKAFDRFDRNHDGTLSPDEFRRLVVRRLRRR